jgi:L-ornithine Nalpha-acyltransferase
MAELSSFPVSIGRIGSLEVRLAVNEAEVDAAQRLRHHVFFGGGPDDRDADAFDAVCDHLVILDHALPGGTADRMVATSRLLRHPSPAGFYSAGEFDIEPLVSRHPGLRFLELGRSCVAATHRGRRTAELLWHGIWSYALEHRIDVMIGCASLEGTDPDRLALPLSFLNARARAPEEWHAAARPELAVAMDRLPAEAIDDRAALRALPPLLKGYLRLGAHIGEGAVVDHAFGTTDVLVVLPVAQISARYVDYYGAEASRHAA